MQDILQVLVQVLKSLQPQDIPHLPDRLLAYGDDQIFDIALNRKHCFPLKRNSESGMPMSKGRSCVPQSKQGR